ncbi:MAG: acetyl-CoA hydrolase/transferase family protein [Bacteriovorax sp.]|nr:acetyl-CoA hydrolase/transferase family protein [Bacteriovorax sp.]
MIKKLNTFFLLVTMLFSFSALAADPCLDLIKELIAKKDFPGMEKTGELVGRLKTFADENKLMYQILDVGPPARRVKKLFVALDMNDDAMVEKYLKEFNLEDEAKPTLALEFGFEVVNEYVSGVLRTSPDSKAPVYRWGKHDLPRNVWAQEWMIKGGFDRYPNRKQNPIWGYSHLIQLNPDEAKNVKFFLANPEERGPCKSDNCVAWTASIELGKTAKGATDEERKYLFNELGVSRSSAHYEIGRRLMHAASERHSGVVVFVNGKAGMKTFEKDLIKFLPPEPQIPYTNIIKGLGHDPKGDLMQAVAKIPDGAKIFFPIAAGASPEAMSALIQAAPALKKGFEISLLVNGINESTLRKGAELADGKIKFKSLFVGSNMRKLHTEGYVQYVPGYLSDFPRFMRDPKMPEFKYDAIVVRVSPADANGNHSFGPNYDMIHAILEGNPNVKIIAEVNEKVPFTTGDNFIHSSKITAFFKSKAELAGPPVVPYTTVEKRIGEALGILIDDGSTLQIGIGNIFGGLPDGLAAAGKKNLKISTEMFGDSLKQIMERGIAKKAETGFAYGSGDLYKWLNKNKDVKFISTEEVNSPANIQQTEKFHAVNTALQVRLTGDVNAEFGPEGRISSPGGQVEFMSGAARSNGGKSVIAIRSTAKNGDMSTIVMNLYDGHVTTPAESVQYVVTEYGIAVLRGKTTSERAIQLINVAHPKFRAQLRDDAIEKHLITPGDANMILIDIPEVVDAAVNAYPNREIASMHEGWFEKFWNSINANFYHVLKIYWH